MAIDIENAVNTLYGTAPISDAPGVEAAEQTVGESQQIIEEVIQQNIAAQSDSPVPEGIPDIPLPPQLTLPASYTPTFTIDNYTNFNITKLRNFFNINKYLEDPIAFVGNYVWTPDFKSPNDTLVFDYRLPPDVDVNLLTNLTLDLILKNIEEKQITKSDEIKKEVINSLGGTAINYAVGPKQTQQQLNFIENYAWFWCSQIFAYNSVKSAGATQFKINEQSLAPLAVAFFMLNDYYQPREDVVGETNEFLFFFKTILQNKQEIKNQKIPLSTATVSAEIQKLINYAEGRRYLNESNYYSNGKSSPATIESQGITSYKFSPFFDSNNQSISNSEFKTTPPVKEVVKCKNTTNVKQETGLRLFYKEGNDNILDKEPPGAGLGCQTNTLAWEQAKNIIFNSESLNGQNKARVNLSLPYYNSVNVKPKNYVPSEVDIAKNLVAQYGDLAISIIGDDTFNAILFLKFLESVNLSENDVLLDTSLNLETVSFNYSNLFLTIQNPIIDKLQSFKLLQNTFAYTGLFNVGYTINKKLDLSLNFVLPNIQSFHVAADITNDEKEFRIYDSQVKYGTEYEYSLSQLIYETTYSYGYKLNRQTSNPGEILNPQVENLITLSITDLVDLKIGGGFFFVEQSKVNAGISFVDLPPLPTFLEVFPIAGVNNKLIFTFENLADSGVITKIIPRQYWSDGWQQAKEYYEKQQGIISFVNDEAYFIKQILQKIKIYSSKVPPKDLDSLKLFKEIDVLSEGYGSIVDLEPNTKYYFAIKSESYTGLESYFSEIYEVEIVDDGGTVFPIVQLYDSLSNEVKRKSQLDFGEKFRIEPALLQQAPNPEKDGIGYLNPTVFSKINETRAQFKIRLTSKKTGKKVDFNIIYKKDFQKASENAGSLNLKETTKDKVLISYKTKEE